ncbi:MAG: hypothetical protein ABI199_04305 [Bacteroidia bacterium]
MQKKYLYYIFVFIVLCCTFPAIVHGQSAYKSEADLKKQAAKFFDKEDFTSAYPLYSQLLSLDPKSGEYNFKFSVCILLSTGDKEKPIGYLEYASKQPNVDKNVFYYLAKAYHLNYRFDDAIAMYQKYKTLGEKSQVEKFQIDRQIEMCRNGKKLLRNISGLDVIEKKELTVEDYFLSYNLPDIGGKLLVEPDDFKTPYDKKQKVNSIIFLSKNNNQIYYSSYGKNGENGKDIYVIRKLPSGEWSKPQNVGYPINTEYDEDYPFLHPNGKVLYFCSKGHNSMGGYDVFKSTWNDSTKSWQQPVNLDFPVNTPDDDILYITDTDEQMAYFSSNRSSPDGKIMIYKINVARKPVDISIIKGEIVKTENNQHLDAKITVQNMETNEIEGIFKGNDSTGNYFMNLPNGGKFLFTVETDGFKTQSGMVTIPVQYELKPLKQEISYEAGTGKLIIKNLFDQPIDDNNYLLAMNYIKQRAKLDVNADSTSSSKNNFSNGGNEKDKNTSQNNSNNNSLAANKNTNLGIYKDSLESSNTSSPDSSSTVSNTDGGGDSSKVINSNLSNSDIVKIAYNDAKESDKEAKDMQKQADMALSIANEKNEETKDKNSEADELQTKADQTQDPSQKQAALEDYNDAKKDASKSAKETVAAFNIATKLQSDATAKRQEADFSQNYAKQLDKVVHSNSKNADDALKQLAVQKDSLEKMNQQPVGTDNVYNNLKSDADNKQTEANDANQTLKNNQQQLTDLDNNINQMQAQADTSSNQTLKQDLQSQVNELKTERTQKQNDLASESKKASELQDESNDLKDQLSMSSGMITKIKQGAQNPSNSDVSSIDKQKLQAEVSSYKQANTAENSADTTNKTTNQQTVIANNNSNSTTDSSVQKNNFSAGDSTENKTADSSNYSTKYSDALAEAEKIPDAYNREEAKSAVYSDWAAAIKNDISEKKTDLKTIKTKKEKKSAEQTIASLQKDFYTKQSLAQQSNQQAETIKQNLASTENTNSGNPNSTSDSSKTISKNNFSDSTNTASANTSKNNTVTPDNTNSTSDSTKTVSKNNNLDSANTARVNTSKNNTGTPDNTNSTSDSSKTISKNNFSDGTNTASVNTSKNNTVTPANTNSTSDSSKTVSKNNFSDNGNTTSSNAKNNSLDATKTIPLYSSTDAVNNENQAKQSEQEAAKENDKYTELMQNASSEKDTAQKTQLIENANAAQAQAQQAQLQSDNAYAKADEIQYVKNNQEIEKFSEATASKDDDDLLIAGAMKDDATLHYNNAQKDRNSAAQESDYTGKEYLLKHARNEENMALSKQQKAIAIYSKYAPDVATQFNQNQNSNSTAVAINAAPNNTGNNPTNNTVKTNNGQSISSADNLKNQSQNINSTASSDNQKIKNTAEYQKYIAMINQSDSLKNVSKTNFAAADNYKTISAAEADSATQNKTVADTIKDSEQKQNLLEKAQYEAIQANLNKSKSDSLTTLANQNQSNFINKKADAATYLNSLDKQTASNIGTVSTPPINTDNSTNSVTNLNPKNNTNTSDNNNTTNTIASNNNINSTQENPANTNVKSNTTTTDNSAVPKNNFSTTASSDSVNKGNSNTAVNETSISLTDVFEASQTPVYTTSNPIPINPKMPNGVYFKVQIGAFRNQIPQDLFKGMKPVIGETTPQGFIRYSAGMFTGIDKADDAKNKIIGMGYKDAFVVAFVNGKRVPMNEAMAALHSSSNEKNTSDNTQQQASSADSNTNQDNQNKNISTTNSSENTVNAAVSTDVVQVKGLFYTVQVGVYKRPEPASKLFNIQPLYSAKTTNGFIRYNSGKFNDFGKANTAKNTIVQIGIKDAFVTAYYNGTRIDPDKAKTLISSRQAQYTSDANTNVMPSQNNQTSIKSQNNNSVNSNPPTNTNTTNPPNTSNTNVPDKNTFGNKIVFKVQIGAYKKQIPLDIANKFLALGGNGVNSFVDENGITIYTTGSFSTFDDAVTLKDKIVKAGITDAFVVAFNNGKKITLDEAQKLLQ